MTDLALALAVALAGVVGQSAASSSAERTAYWVVVVGCCAALTIRTGRPHASLTGLAAFLLLHVVLVERLSVFAAVVCMVAAYTAGARLGPLWRWVFLAATYLGPVAAILLSADPGLGDSWSARAVLAALTCAMITVAALSGALRRRGRARVELALDRAAVLEAQQDTERRLAAVEERTRIAREMHDILGHSLGAIAVQAEGARYVLASDPTTVDRALADIGRLSRGAVDEVRGLVDVLRDDDEPATRRPAPTLEDLSELVGSFRHSGTVVRLRLENEETDDANVVPAHVGLAAYRIVQEALTNAVKHAGQAPVMIRVRVAKRRAELLIVNGRPTGARPGPTGRRGHGLTGMRERARALGGTFVAGPDPATGGWRVAATVPWGRA
jgi:signal transduction histidine kinase